MLAKFYGLLYLNEEEFSTENIYTKSFRDLISVYLNCAVTLSNSLNLRGISFTLLTNKKDVLEKMAQSKAKALQIREIPFTTEVPRKIKFYSAHFKLDILRYLSSLNDDYVGLCDLDMICINDLPSSFLSNINRKIPMFYDISDQVIPAYGYEAVSQSLKLIHNLDSEGRWSGGEFISGSPDFFQVLTQEINNIFNNYTANIDKLHHIGDEAITSAALEVIRLRGIYVADAGTLGIIGRYWNTKCLHPQKPFEYFQQCFLLHLPADKRLLSSLASRREIDPSTFKDFYKQYIKSLKITSWLKQLTKSFLLNKLLRRFSNAQSN